MRIWMQFLFASLLLCMILPSWAVSGENWKTYRLAVMRTELEVALPLNLLNEITRRDWRAPYRAVRLDELYSAKTTEERAFNALLDIKGPFGIGVSGYIKFFGVVARKPEWFRGNLFDITELNEMMKHRVVVLGKGSEFHFEIVNLNGMPWIHWCDYDPNAPSTGRVRRLDRYSRPLTDDLYLDVAIDQGNASVSDNLGWLKTADRLRERLKNSLVIRYPIDTKMPHP